MINIMFLNNWGEPPAELLERYKRQTPGNNGVWGDIKAISDPDDVDFFIVMEGMPGNIKKGQIPKEKIIYFQREPDEIIKTFGLPDHFGGEALFRGTFKEHYNLAVWFINVPFEELTSLQAPAKPKKLSAIMSSKNMTYGHKQRLKFLYDVRKAYQAIEIYGHGFTKEQLGDSYKGVLNYNGHCKYRGLIDYEYSLAIDNVSMENMFDEKIIDCFLTWTKPVYWGCKNIDKFFPANSYVWVDIYDPDAAKRVKEEIEKPVDYEALKEARELVLYKYNLWPSIERIINKYTIATYEDHTGKTKINKYATAKQSDIDAKISPHLLKFLSEERDVLAEEIDPLELFTYKRFDLPAKYIYAKLRDIHADSTYGIDLYSKHLLAFNGYKEGDGTGKEGLELFLAAFNDILDDINNHGFDSDRYAIPVSRHNNVLDGSHRLAACLYSKKPVTAYKFHFEGWHYTHTFFRRRGLSEGHCDAIAYEYCILKENTYLALLFPSAVGRDEEVRTILQRYGSIFYEKQVHLFNNGPMLLMAQIYKDENWLGDFSNNFAGARLKAQECFRTELPVRIFLLETDNPQDLKKAKDEIRSVYQISNHSIHINDTHDETIRVAQLLFNENSIHFLNHASLSNFPQFQRHYKILQGFCKDKHLGEKELLCVTGSAVMAIYGIRDARDIDYFHFMNDLPADPSKALGSHNKEIGYYTKTRDDIIFNPENHFYFDGFKFAALQVIHEMKEKRREEKDIVDIALIQTFLETKKKYHAKGYGRESSQPQSAPIVSIIILNYNGLSSIQPCIDSILRNTPEPYEIIVFDNASTDDSPAYLRSLPKLVLVENPVNLGCPAGRAKAMSYIHPESKYIIFLDNDTVVTKGWTTKFIAHAEKDPGIGMMGPRSNYVSGIQIVRDASYKNIAELESFAKRWSAKNTGKLTSTHRLVGFCMFITKNVINKLGSIDASFGKFGFEDDDYTWRALIAGFKTLIADDVFIHHQGGPQGQGNTTYNHALFEAWETFKNKWGIPKDISYGSPLEISAILTQPFDADRHHIALTLKRDEENGLNLAFTRAREAIAVSIFNGLVNMNPASGVIYAQTARGTAGTSTKIAFQADAVKEIPSLIHPELIPGLTSIIILTQNRLDRTKKCVKSIRKHTPEPHEIIFVDNGSTDETVKWLQGQVKENKNYRLIENKENVGLAKGRNQGINLSQGEFILLMDNDVLVSEGWLDGMLECLNRVPAAGIVGPMTNNISGLQQVMDESYRSVDYLDKYAIKFKKQYRHRQIPYRNIAGFCMLFKRRLAEKTGLLDERFDTGHFEDEDFCLRASLEDYRNYIAGDVFVHHHGGKPSPGDKKILEEKWVLNVQSSLGKKLAVLKSTELADELYQKGKVDQAAEALINCIKLTPEAKEIYYELARMFIESKRYSEALEVVESMPDSAREELKGLEYAGYSKEGLGLDDEAAGYAERMLTPTITPTPTLPRKGEGSIEGTSVGKYPPALNLCGVLAYKKGEKEKAADYFKIAIDADPGYGEAYTNLGVLYWSMDKKDEALAHLRKGFVLSPTVPATSSLYYSVVSSLGMFSDAEDVFREAQGLHPNHKNIAFLYIDALIQQGKFSVAMTEVEDAIAVFGLDEGILAAALLVREKLAPLAPEKKGSKKATLSVCMIVKNEEEHLVKCLKSVRDVADEMIVVDTGSTDSTKDIATVFGAKVFDFPWTGDFSEARNHSLAQATCDWILVLDADEVISSLDHKRLLKTIARGKQRPVAFDMVTRNYLVKSGSAGWTENDGTYPQEEKGVGWYGSNKVRLFRSSGLVRFENPVHELLEASLGRAGIPIEKCTIPIHHYGRLNQEKILAKGRDYFLLGRKKLEERGGGDYVAIRELAAQAGELGMFEEAIELWQQALALRPDDVDSLFNLSYHYMQIGKYQEALQAAKRSVELSPGTKDAVLNYALCEMLLGNALKTTALLEEFVSSGNENPTLMAVLGVSYCVGGYTDKGLAILKKLTIARANNVQYYVNSLVAQLITSGQIEYARLLIDAALSGNIADRETLRLRDENR